MQNDFELTHRKILEMLKLEANVNGVKEQAIINFQSNKNKQEN